MASASHPEFSVVKEYLIFLKDESVKVFFNNNEIRSVCHRTNCHIELTKRILNRRLGDYKIVKYAIIQIRGRDDFTIRQCNRLLEQKCPQYRNRQEYVKRSDCCTIYAEEFAPDNASLYFQYQRSGATTYQFGNVILKSPFEPSAKRTLKTCYWKLKDPDMKKAILTSNSKQAETYFSSFLKTSSRHAYDTNCRSCSFKKSDILACKNKLPSIKVQHLRNVDYRDYLEQKDLYFTEQELRIEEKQLLKKCKNEKAALERHSPSSKNEKAALERYSPSSKVTQLSTNKPNQSVTSTATKEQDVHYVECSKLSKRTSRKVSNRSNPPTVKTSCLALKRPKPLETRIEVKLESVGSIMSNFNLATMLTTKTDSSPTSIQSFLTIKYQQPNSQPFEAGQIISEQNSPELIGFGNDFVDLDNMRLSTEKSDSHRLSQETSQHTEVVIFGQEVDNKALSSVDILMQNSVNKADKHDRKLVSADEKVALQPLEENTVSKETFTKPEMVNIASEHHLSVDVVVGKSVNREYQHASDSYPNHNVDIINNITVLQENLISANDVDKDNTVSFICRSEVIKISSVESSVYINKVTHMSKNLSINETIQNQDLINTEVTKPSHEIETEKYGSPNESIASSANLEIVHGAKKVDSTEDLETRLSPSICPDTHDTTHTTQTTKPSMAHHSERMKRNKKTTVTVKESLSVSLSSDKMVTSESNVFVEVSESICAEKVDHNELVSSVEESKVLVNIDSKNVHNNRKHDSKQHIENSSDKNCQIKNGNGETAAKVEEHDGEINADFELVTLEFERMKSLTDLDEELNLDCAIVEVNDVDTGTKENKNRVSSVINSTLSFECIRDGHLDVNIIDFAFDDKKVQLRIEKVRGISETGESTTRNENFATQFVEQKKDDGKFELICDMNRISTVDKMETITIDIAMCKPQEILIQYSLSFSNESQNECAYNMVDTVADKFIMPKIEHRKGNSDDKKMSLTKISEEENILTSTECEKDQLTVSSFKEANKEKSFIVDISIINNKKVRKDFNSIIVDDVGSTLIPKICKNFQSETNVSLQSGNDESVFKLELAVKRVCNNEKQINLDISDNAKKNSLQQIAKKDDVLVEHESLLESVKKKKPQSSFVVDIAIIHSNEERKEFNSIVVDDIMKPSVKEITLDENNVTDSKESGFIVDISIKHSNEEMKYTTNKKSLEDIIEPENACKLDSVREPSTFKGRHESSFVVEVAVKDSSDDMKDVDPNNDENFKTYEQKHETVDISGKQVSSKIINKTNDESCFIIDIVIKRDREEMRVFNPALVKDTEPNCMNIITQHDGIIHQMQKKKLIEPCFVVEIAIMHNNEVRLELPTMIGNMNKTTHTEIPLPESDVKTALESNENRIEESGFVVDISIRQSNEENKEMTSLLVDDVKEQLLVENRDKELPSKEHCFVISEVEKGEKMIDDKSLVRLNVNIVKDTTEKLNDLKISFIKAEQEALTTQTPHTTTNMHITDLVNEESTLECAQEVRFDGIIDGKNDLVVLSIEGKNENQDWEVTQENESTIAGLKGKKKRISNKVENHVDDSVREHAPQRSTKKDGEIEFFTIHSEESKKNSVLQNQHDQHTFTELKDKQKSVSGSLKNEEGLLETDKINDGEFELYLVNGENKRELTVGEANRMLLMDVEPYLTISISLSDYDDRNSQGPNQTEIRIDVQRRNYLVSTSLTNKTMIEEDNIDIEIIKMEPVHNVVENVISSSHVIGELPQENVTSTNINPSKKLTSSSSHKQTSTPEINVNLSEVAETVSGNVRQNSKLDGTAKKLSSPNILDEPTNDNVANAKISSVQKKLSSNKKMSNSDGNSKIPDFIAEMAGEDLASIELDDLTPVNIDFEDKIISPKVSSESQRENIVIENYSPVDKISEFTHFHDLPVEDAVAETNLDIAENRNINIENVIHSSNVLPDEKTSSLPILTESLIKEVDNKPENNDMGNPNLNKTSSHSANLLSSLAMQQFPAFTEDIQVENINDLELEKPASIHDVFEDFLSSTLVSDDRSIERKVGNQLSSSELKNKTSIPSTYVKLHTLNESMLDEVIANTEIIKPETLSNILEEVVVSSHVASEVQHENHTDNDINPDKKISSLIDRQLTMTGTDVKLPSIVEVVNGEEITMSEVDKMLLEDHAMLELISPAFVSGQSVENIGAMKRISSTSNRNILIMQTIPRLSTINEALNGEDFVVTEKINTVDSVALDFVNKTAVPDETHKENAAVTIAKVSAIDQNIPLNVVKSKSSKRISDHQTSIKAMSQNMNIELDKMKFSDDELGGLKSQNVSIETPLEIETIDNVNPIEPKSAINTKFTTFTDTLLEEIIAEVDLVNLTPIEGIPTTDNEETKEVEAGFEDLVSTHIVTSESTHDKIPKDTDPGLQNTVSVISPSKNSNLTIEFKIDIKIDLMLQGKHKHDPDAKENLMSEEKQLSVVDESGNVHVNVNDKNTPINIHFTTLPNKSNVTSGINEKIVHSFINLNISLSKSPNRTTDYHVDVKNINCDIEGPIIVPSNVDILSKVNISPIVIAQSKTLPTDNTSENERTLKKVIFDKEKQAASVVQAEQAKVNTNLTKTVSQESVRKLSHSTPSTQAELDGKALKSFDGSEKEPSLKSQRCSQLHLFVSNSPEELNKQIKEQCLNIDSVNSSVSRQKDARKTGEHNSQMHILTRLSDIAGIDLVVQKMSQQLFVNLDCEIDRNTTYPQVKDIESESESSLTLFSINFEIPFESNQNPNNAGDKMLLEIDDKSFRSVSSDISSLTDVDKETLSQSVCAYMSSKKMDSFDSTSVDNLETFISNKLDKCDSEPSIPFNESSSFASFSSNTILKFAKINLSRISSLTVSSFNLPFKSKKKFSKIEKSKMSQCSINKIYLKVNIIRAAETVLLRNIVPRQNSEMVKHVTICSTTQSALNRFFLIQMLPIVKLVGPQSYPWKFSHVEMSPKEGYGCLIFGDVRRYKSASINDNESHLSDTTQQMSSDLLVNGCVYSDHNNYKTLSENDREFVERYSQKNPSFDNTSVLILTEKSEKTHPVADGDCSLSDIIQYDNSLQRIIRWISKNTRFPND